MEGPCRLLGSPSYQKPRGLLPTSFVSGPPQRPGTQLRKACSRKSVTARAASKRSKAYAASTLEGQDVKEVGAEPHSGGIPDLWRQMADQHGDLLALSDPHQSPPAKYTFRELNSHMRRFASGLQQVGLKAGDVVSLFSENSSRWLVADQSTMMVGAADAVRGSTGSVDEMSFIIKHSGSCGVIVQDTAALERLLPGLAGSQSTPGNGDAPELALQDSLQFIVVLWGEASDRCTHQLDCPVYSFNDIIAKGQLDAEFPHVTGDTLATLVYTSGTTGSPKGVELTHANILYQIANLGYYLQVSPGQTVLSLLPPWHIYERTCSYYILSCGGQQTYTSIRKFKDDLTVYPPDHFVCVPLVLDSLYTKVQQQLRKGSAVKRTLANFFLAVSATYIRARRVIQGVSLEYARQQRPFLAILSATLSSILLAPLHRLGKLLVYKKIRQAIGIRQTVVSGGGSLASHLDDFYEVIGLEVLNGWGLSETAPVLACRRDGSNLNVRGSIGLAIPGTTLKIVDPETLKEVADGELGLILAAGPGVMRRYRNDPSSTQTAMRAGQGLFDTGDLGWRAPDGVPGSRMAGTIVLAGRSKDTIVLSNGENVEPQPIEDACCASSYISHMLVVGQDKRMLGALVAPHTEAFEELEKVKGELSQEEKEALLKSEISKFTSHRPSRERIVNIVLLPQPLAREDGTLTQTLKPRRQAVYSKYGAELERLMRTLR